jgi:hypothetical protein
MQDAGQRLYILQCTSSNSNAIPRPSTGHMGVNIPHVVQAEARSPRSRQQAPATATATAKFAPAANNNNSQSKYPGFLLLHESFLFSLIRFLFRNTHTELASLEPELHGHPRAPRRAHLTEIGSESLGGCLVIVPPPLVRPMPSHPRMDHREKRQFNGSGSG